MDSDAETRRVVICGGSGAVGQRLAKSLVADGRDVVIVSRSPGGYKGPGRAIAWEELAPSLDGAAGVVNLAGAPVAQRWTKRALKMIERSRVESVEKVVAALRQADRPPQAWVQASAVGYYGDRGDEELAENAPPGEGVLASICQAWEAAAAVEVEGVRQAIVRIGVVFERDAGAWPVLRRLARFGLGGRAGDGRQWVPWIAAEDLTRIFRLALDDERASGVINAASPRIARNADVMRFARAQADMPIGLPAPAWGIRLARKTVGVPDEIALASQRAVPNRLAELGFTFAHPALTPQAISA